MGRHYNYRPGQFYRQDDRTGFAQYADRTRKQWNGLIVDQSVFEPRQPQDLVRGVKDVQSVVDARPMPEPSFDGPAYLTLAAPFAPGQPSFVLNGIAGLTVGGAIGIFGNDGAAFYTGIASIGYGGNADAITITGRMGVAAAAGNLVVVYNRPYTSP